MARDEPQLPGDMPARARQSLPGIDGRPGAPDGQMLPHL